MECDCKTIQAVTPEPSGNTQVQATLFGQRSTKNGQPVTKAAGVAPDGSLKVKIINIGMNGAFMVSDGDTWAMKDGIIVFATATAQGTIPGGVVDGVGPAPHF